jgi:predicted AAA+ superfamily ATPase
MLTLNRTSWINSIESAWHRKSIIWLAGVRRVGKTCLAQSLSDVEYFDCELPRVRRLLDDNEAFLEKLGTHRIVLDEIHRLENPSQLLKIAADHFPNVKVIATGSSTLSASVKFRDTLTGRKAQIWLTPMLEEDLSAFGNTDIEFRLLRGGLPPFFLADALPETDFQDWMDDFWAKDIQELFRLERRQSFQKFVELLICQSGGIFEATRFSKACEISRTTISTYLNVLESTFIAHIIRPFNSRRSDEIIKAPKVYAFDTGFVAYYKGWRDLRSEDLGFLWEHFVLNELTARLQGFELQYWRDKHGHEVDFIMRSRSGAVTAVECKWQAGEFNPRSLASFRRVYPGGANYVVGHDVGRSYSKRFDDLEVQFVSLSSLCTDALPAVTKRDQSRK